MNSKSSGSRLVSLLARLVGGEGFTSSLLPVVKFMHTTRYIPRTPIAYEPGIFILAQGRKTGYLGTRKIVYDANHYLVASVPVPFECETEGSLAKPMLAVKI